MRQSGNHYFLVNELTFSAIDDEGIINVQDFSTETFVERCFGTGCLVSLSNFAVVSFC